MLSDYGCSGSIVLTGLLIMEKKMSRLNGHIYILLTIFFTVYGQLIFKWRLAKIGSSPEEFLEKLKFFILLVFDPFVFSGYLAAFFASLTWMFALGKYDLNYAYPFMSLNFVVVLVVSGLLLNEPITIQRIVGICLIVFGTVVSSRS